MKRLALYMTLFLNALMVQGADRNDITYMDWAEMRIDSVLPVYSEVVPLESDYRLYDYAVRVEYPEWGTLSAKELEVVGRFRHLLQDALDVHSTVTVSRKVGMLDLVFYPLIYKDGQYHKLLSGKIVITPVRKSNRIRRVTDTADRYTRNSVLAQGTWVKISITEDGMYRLTRSALKNMGISNPDNVRLFGYGGHRQSEVLNPDEEYDDLQEVPLYKVDNDTWLFWGNGLVYWDGDTRVFNPYANAACYFVTEGDSPSSMTTRASLTDAPVNVYQTYTEHALYEKDEYAWFSGGRNLYESNNYASSNGRTYKFSNINCTGAAKLKVVFTASASSSTTLTPTVNGTSLSSMNISAIGSYQSAASNSKTYDVSDLNIGTTWSVKLTSTTGHDARLDYLSLGYTAPLALRSDVGYVAFSGSGRGISRFDITGTDLKVMRLGTPGNPAVVVDGTQNAGVYSIVVDDATQDYVAFRPSEAYPQPVVVGKIENQNLHALDSVDMVIIVPQSGKLEAQAQRLADAHRQYDGMNVAVVRADRIYNEFSSGTPDATAYRRLMKMLYDRAKSDDVAPKYLLLMGDCAWDNRMISTAWKNYKPEDYLLCFESENSLSDTQCYVMEDYFGLLDDGEGGNLTSDKTDLGVGRFPVTSAEEAKVMVDKTIAFLSNSNAGNWKNVISILGDDGDENEHLKYADDVAERIIASNPEMEVRKVMWDAYTRVSTISHNTYPDVTELIKNQMSEGALVMNYTGHGATYCLSHEFVLQLTDFAQFQGTRLPLWVTAACDVMPFDGQSANIGETAVLNADGAAVAFLGTARTVYAYNNLQLNRWFMRYLLATDASGRRYRVGDALRLAKNYLISGNLEASNRQNKLHYALLGDPALVFGAPVNRVVLDSINGMPVGDHAQLRAGESVRMEGHVESQEGNMLSDFTGVLSARLYDNLETVTCLNNAGASSAFTFTNREKVLFNGQDSIRAGKFNLSFVVPVDINFSDENGRVVFYAINEDRSVEANGYCEDFVIGGVSTNEDTEGPEIAAYLNTENFENGGRVNATPFFVAQLQDESGVNYSGSGLGHDLLLIIDNNPEHTYVLNDYYTTEFGDYTKGTVAYSIPELEDGKHSLTFRAWDVLNNTSSYTLDFVTDASQKPTVLDVTVSQSPATTTTNFLVTHDRAGAECTFTIDVYDFAGRRMWHHSEQTTSSSRLYSLPWNLTTNSGGRLSSGIYLYQVTLQSGDSKKVSKSQKIIIRSNN